MAQEFNVSLKNLVDQYRQNTEPGFRYHVVAELRALADFINKSDPWPAEVEASEEAIKKGFGSISEPTEAEMKRAAADEEAAKLARLRGIEDDYTSEAEPDVPQDAKDQRMERQFAEFRGDSRAGENVPGRPFPAVATEQVPDQTKPTKEAADKAAADQKAADQRAADQKAEASNKRR